MTHICIDTCHEAVEHEDNKHQHFKVNWVFFYYFLDVSTSEVVVLCYLYGRRLVVPDSPLHLSFFSPLRTRSLCHTAQHRKLVPGGDMVLSG